MQQRNPISKKIFYYTWVFVVIFVSLSFLYLDIPIASLFQDQKPNIWNVTLYNITEYGRSFYYLVPSALLFIIFYIICRKSYGIKRTRFMRYSAKTLFAFISVAIVGLLTNLLKIIFGRSRPRMFFDTGEYGFQWFNFSVDHWSFPSGHVTNIVSFFTALILITPSKKRIYLLPFLFFVVLVVFSRVTVGAHYLSDVVFSSCWSASVTMALFIFARRYCSGYFYSLSETTN